MPDLVVTPPPAAFDLRWTDLGARNTSNGPRRLFEARSTTAFDAAWTGGRRAQLREMGYGTKRGDSGWMAQFWAKPSAAEEAARAAATAQAVEASRATDAAVEIPAPEGRTYLPYQRAGIAYAMARPATLIGDEMGLGKTIQAIGVLNAGQAKRVLIACPASLKLNWKRELAAWLVEPLPVHVVDGGKRQFPDVASGGVIVINYDVMHSYEAQVRAVSWDLFVADEAHLLKSKKARRTRAVFGGSATKTAAAVAPIAARRRLLLTGTPMSNRPSELHPLLAFLDRPTWGEFFPYARRYCNAHQTRFGWDFDGSSHLDELQDKLRASVMVRRLKKDVLKELPPKVRQVVPLEAGTAALRRLLADEEAAHEAWEALASAGAASRAAAFADLSRARERVGLAKAPLVAEHVLRDEGPVVVFAHHKAVIEALSTVLVEAGRTVVTATGDMGAPERQASVDAFQAGEADVIVGTYGAMGVGWTLVRSSHVVCAEMDWVPATMSQAEDRCHRIGQAGSVHVEHLVFEASLDARLVEVVVEKQAVLNAVLDDRIEEAATAIQDTADAPATAPAMEDIAPIPVETDEAAALREIEAEAAAEATARSERKVRQEVEEQARRATRAASDDEAREGLRAALAAAGWALDADDHARAERLVGDGAWHTGDRTTAQVLTVRLTGYVERAAGRVATAEIRSDDQALVADAEVRALVLEACRHLSGLDVDRASEENGVGWSKTTSWTGHWLAGHDALDERAAAVGLGLLRIHRRQLADHVQARLFGDVERSSTPRFAPSPVEVALPLDSPAEDRVPEVLVPEVVAPEPEALAVVEIPEPEPAPPIADPKRKRPPDTPENNRARDRLYKVGTALFGPRWMTDLARELRVADRTVRRWDSGHTPIPATLWADIAEVAQRRRDALDAIIDSLDDVS